MIYLAVLFLILFIVSYKLELYLDYTREGKILLWYTYKGQRFYKIILRVKK